jgi:hypothetical protein
MFHQVPSPTSLSMTQYVYILAGYNCFSFMYLLMIEMTAMALGETFSVHFRTPDNALVMPNIMSFYIQTLSQFVKPPSDTLLRYYYN